MMHVLVVVVDLHVSFLQRVLRSFELWRWAFFAGLLFPVWLCGSLLTFFLIRIVEANFLTTRNVLYFIAAVRVSNPGSLRRFCYISKAGSCCISRSVCCVSSGNVRGIRPYYVFPSPYLTTCGLHTINEQDPVVMGLAP